MTICRQWAWKPNDQLKSLQECVQTLIQTVGDDGNLLLNVGLPKARSGCHRLNNESSAAGR